MPSSSRTSSTGPAPTRFDDTKQQRSTVDANASSMKFSPLALFLTLAAVYLVCEVVSKIGSAWATPRLRSAQTLHIVVGLESLLFSLLLAAFFDLKRLHAERRGRGGTKPQKDTERVQDDEQNRDHEHLHEQSITRSGAATEPRDQGRENYTSGKSWPICCAPANTVKTDHAVDSADPDASRNAPLQPERRGGVSVVLVDIEPRRLSLHTPSSVDRDNAANWSPEEQRMGEKEDAGLLTSLFSEGNKARGVPNNTTAGEHACSALLVDGTTITSEPGKQQRLTEILVDDDMEVLLAGTEVETEAERIPENLSAGQQGRCQTGHPQTRQRPEATNSREDNEAEEAASSPYLLRQCFMWNDGFWLYMPVAIAFAVFNALETFQLVLVRGSPGVLSVLSRSSFLLVMIGSVVFLKRKFTKWQYVFAGLVLLGIVLFQISNMTIHDGPRDEQMLLNSGAGRTRINASNKNSDSFLRRPRRSHSRNNLAGLHQSFSSTSADEPDETTPQQQFTIAIVLALVASCILALGTLYREKGLKKTADSWFFVQKFHIEAPALVFLALFLFVVPEILFAWKHDDPEWERFLVKKLRCPRIRSWDDLFQGWYDKGDEDFGAWRIHLFALLTVATQWCGDLVVKRRSTVVRLLLKFLTPILVYYLGDRLLFKKNVPNNWLQEVALLFSSLLLLVSATTFAVLGEAEKQNKEDAHGNEMLGEESKPCDEGVERHELNEEELSAQWLLPQLPDESRGSDREAQHAGALTVEELANLPRPHRTSV
ncbi:unnamed protein product [Amoebophrya sp. A120]|nr:unnamed protein product [Amoebophrya sp. A120]|eukprot:GSA120T00005251001.1